MREEQGRLGLAAAGRIFDQYENRTAGNRDVLGKVLRRGRFINRWKQFTKFSKRRWRYRDKLGLPNGAASARTRVVSQIDA